MNASNQEDTRVHRLGLALSGGGFRASFFHIGVLARMAEMDLLRHVQVISTVSGGSVVGALYYLYVRNLLQRKPDADIERADYVGLVADLQRHFEQAVQKNLRMRTFGNLVWNWKMSFKKYSRSDRMAALYAKHLFAPVVEEALRPHVPLSKLKIVPCGEEADFHPFKSSRGGPAPNDARQHKVPALVINATALNTGHNFQFTATWMGEPPPQPAQGLLDKNRRLMWAYYGDLPEKYQVLPLGIAVAASTAVSGLFPPLPLTDLYPEMTLQLVDGGVHDNQGTEGLLDLACTHLIVSDACGQMQDVEEPPAWALPVLKRSFDVSMDRVREEQYEGLTLRKQTGVIRDFVFMHLKQDLPQREVTWSGGEDQWAGAAGTTPYGVDQQVQELLADIRTDLDSFTEVESHALMADGYLIAEHKLAAAQTAFNPQGISLPLQDPAWHFLDMAPHLQGATPSLLRQLRVAGAQFAKVWKLLLPNPKLLMGILAVGIVFCLLRGPDTLGITSVFEWGVSAFRQVMVYVKILFVVLIVYGVLYLFPRRIRGVLFFKRIPLALIFGTAAWIVTWAHLLVFDKVFLYLGKASRLK